MILPLGCPNCWRPPLNTSWQGQLEFDSGQTSIKTSIPADMYDIDGFKNDAAVVSTLHGLPGTQVPSRHVVCYFEAGTSANFRPDAESFPGAIQGKPYSRFPDERWLDIRQLSVLAPLMRARMDMCKEKGFDAIEFDNIDGWDPSNSTGLNLAYQDEMAFIAFLANETHARGLSMAFKYDLGQIPDALPYVEMAVDEQCFQYNECLTSQNNGKFGLNQLVAAGKPVFELEYRTYDPLNNVCARANSYNFNTLYKHTGLDSYRVACR